MHLQQQFKLPQFAADWQQFHTRAPLLLKEMLNLVSVGTCGNLPAAATFGEIYQLSKLLSVEVQFWMVHGMPCFQEVKFYTSSFWTEVFTSDTS